MTLNYNNGDLVEIKTKEETFQGIIIPRPKILDQEILVLKLNSGYNIGIKLKEITKLKIIEKKEHKKKEQITISNKPNLPTIAFVSLGGTISSKIDYSTGGVSADYDANDFIEFIPEIKNIANIKAEQMMQIMSEDIDLPTISKIAKGLEKWINDDSIKGIVVTSGTDCLHYLTAALTFMIKTNKPIIFTAAQRSIDRGSSDAFMNISCSVKAAIDSNINEVMVCMHEKSDDKSCILIRGNKVRKMHTSRRDAFRPINILPYARITYPELNIIKEGKFSKPFNKLEKNVEDKNNNKNNDGNEDKKENPIKLTPNLNEKVALVHIYPGIKEELIDFYISKNYKGIVLSATALGHIPTSGESNLLPAIERAIKKGIIVVVASQTLYGRTNPYVYTNLRKLSINLGCIFAEDMLPETAYMKLAWLLGNYTKKEEVKGKFSENLAGEINEIIDEESFLN